ncbi:MAG TPA: extracellular solute-binding protein, partial [Spirochaetia bacterium]|nr:extracellular solute-binding protein [Spirochaetia bacterium]
MKRLFVFLLILCISSTLLFAGGAKESGKKVTLSWMWQPEAMGDYENGGMMTALRAKFPEVTFSLQPILYSAYKEKFPVLMASGDMPDIYETNSQSYLPQLVEAKLAAPLDDVLAKYGKDITGNARDGHLAFGKYGGKQYAIPGSYSLKYFAQNIRMDWLDNLGLAVPQTLEEFRNVARAFTFKDPDGNGKNDTYGTAFRQNINFIDSWFNAFGVAP